MQNFKNVLNSLIVLNIQEKLKIIVPIRCFSCNKPIAHLWMKFKARVAEGEEAGKVLDELGLERYCCRAMFLGQVDMIDEISRFKKF